MKNYIKKLERLIEKDESVNFDNILNSVVKNNHTEIIFDLLTLLDDNYSYQDLLWNIIHVTESFPQEDYSVQMVKSLGVLIKKAPDWAEVIIFRNLNNTNYFKKMIENINVFNRLDKKEMLDFILKSIENDEDFLTQYKVVSEINSVPN